MNVSKLFEKEPEQWGLRGDPYFWAYLKELAEEKDFSSPDELEKWIKDEFRSLSGKEMSVYTDVRIEQFAHGGMSSGGVCGPWWIETGIPLLKSRWGTDPDAEETAPEDTVRIAVVTASQMDALWELQTAYKAEIGEEAPTYGNYDRLKDAIETGKIRFYAAWDDDLAVGCCSVTVGFSTFLYAESGVFEDFYIRPLYRHRGIARKLVEFARAESGVSTLTVGCAPSDVPMYRSLGFSIPLGKLLAYD